MFYRPFALAFLLIAPLPQAFAASDPVAGKLIFQRCAICHSDQKGENRMGPSLFGVVGRHSASVSDFEYSDAMKAAERVWEVGALDAFLAKPRDAVPGTRMAFPGLPVALDRQNVIAYLATLK